VRPELFLPWCIGVNNLKLIVKVSLADAADRLDAGEEHFNNLRIKIFAGTGIQLLKDLRLVPSFFIARCDPRASYTSASATSLPDTRISCPFLGLAAPTLIS
jgi:hypothetical protein